MASSDPARDDSLVPRQSVARWVASNLHYSAIFFSLLNFVAAGLVTVLVDPTERDFDLDDPTISHEHKGSTVHIWFVFATCVVSAAAIYAGELRDRSVDHTRAMRFRHGIQLGIDALSASFLTLAVTMFVKVAVGNPRPDLLSTCPTGVGCNPDSLQSFPSGHTSFAFAISSYAGFYLFWAIYIRGMPPLAEWHWHAIPTLVAGGPRPSSPRGAPPPPSPLPTLGGVLREELAHMGRLFAICLPQAMAIGVGISRVLDNRHTLLDVTAGALIGVLVSFFVFLRTVLLMERSPRSPVPDRVSGGGGGGGFNAKAPPPPSSGVELADAGAE